MLKMFHRTEHSGGSAEFWEEAWTEGDYTESARYCEVDPLRAFFDRNIQPGSVMLEGGCGRGLYVAHQTARGVRAIGMDFAVKTLLEVRSRYPHLVLGAADVARLPLRSGTVDSYYSGGVVEHFEAGPDAAIAEARRVLKPGATLLISVPYYSPLRRALAPFRTEEWQRTNEHRGDAPPAGRVFFQYAYTPVEFERILERHGFSVVRTQGYSILWGLYELPLLGPLLGRLASGRGGGGGVDGRPTAGSPPVDGQPPESPRRPALTVLKRLAVSEDDSLPVAGLGVRFLRWFGANMMMYECVAASPGEGGGRG